jgi:hypothetical protein
VTWAFSIDHIIRYFPESNQVTKHGNEYQQYEEQRAEKGQDFRAAHILPE